EDHDRVDHRMVDPQSLRRHPGIIGDGSRRPARDGDDAGRRDPGPVGKPGDRLRRLDGPEPAGDRGPGHLSAHVEAPGLAGVKVIRSSSEFNFSMITIIFDDSVAYYFARDRVLEKLTTVAPDMPPGVTPYLAADATAVGQIFWYTVEGEGKSLDELR